jgi:hypothetical protein
LPALFALIGGIVVVAMAVAWRVRFHGAPEYTAPHGPEVPHVRRDPHDLNDPHDVPAPAAVAPDANSVEQSAVRPPDGPLPPSVFLSAVEKALGQRVLSLRLRTPSNVFKLEPPQSNDLKERG